MNLGLKLSLATAGGLATRPPSEALPADGYQEPEANGDEGYYRTASEGWYQEPEA